MRVVLQRVSDASVAVGGEVVGRIGPGLVLLVGFTTDDAPETVVWMAEKVAGLRVFPDDDGKMNRSLVEVGGQALVVSQFTLYGDCRKGRRPSFVGAAGPDVAIPLYDRFVAELRHRVPAGVETGRFGAEMQVALVNEGPVTLTVER